jgi:hypothetical protein
MAAEQALAADVAAFSSRIVSGMTHVGLGYAVLQPNLGHTAHSGLGAFRASRQLRRDMEVLSG